MSLYKEVTGYIVHQRNYRDSSLIIEFLSHKHGMMHIIAKGIKKNKILKTQLQYFSKIKVGYFGKSELKTLTAVDVIENNQLKNLVNKTSGLYLNELIHYCLLNGDKAEYLFDTYVYTIENLGKQQLSYLLRNFEKALLKHLGFELSVIGFADKSAWLSLINNNIEITTSPSLRLCQVSDLDGFLKGENLAKEAQQRLNRFMLKMIDMCVSHRKIYSREILMSLAAPLKY